MYVIFFLRAGDGIRAGHVTGVQTCALPISSPRNGGASAPSTRRCRPRTQRSRAQSWSYLVLRPFAFSTGYLRPVRSSLSSTICPGSRRSEEHTSELQSRGHLVCRLLLEKNK